MTVMQTLGRTDARQTGDAGPRGNLAIASLVMAAVAAFSPVKSLAFVAPYVLIGLYLIRSGQSDARSVRRLILATSLTVSAWLALTLLHGIVQSRFSFTAAALSLVTYGPLIYLLAIPSPMLSWDVEVKDRFKRFAAWLLVLQSVVGTVQGLWMYSVTGTFLGSTGDAVEGTIHLQLGPSGTFSNPIFAANVAFLLILLLPGVVMGDRTRLSVGAVAIGGLAFVMASVVHVLLFLALALMIGGLPALVRSRLRTKLRGILTASAASYLAFALIGPNLLTISTYSRMLAGGELPRAEVWHSVIMELPQEYPYVPLIGLGPGQFSSRAGMVSSGVYATGVGVRLSSQPSEAQRRFLLDAYARSLEGHPFGSTGQPLSSWLSVYTEFGAFVTAIVLGSAFVVVRRRVRRLRQAGCSADAWSLLSASILFLLLGFQENYWETPQAVMIGLVMIKAISRPRPNDARSLAVRRGRRPHS